MEHKAMNNNLSVIRNEYRKGELDITHVDPDPVSQFGLWMDQAIAAGVEEPTAMTLATATRHGVPSARIVLLKGFDTGGFTFFTNYRSRKAAELEENPHAALLFLWKELERQVRIEGTVEKVTGEESDSYFASRPPESQVGAIVSPQSHEVPDRQYLENLREDFLSTSKPPYSRPPSWGGYRLRPTIIEFWQGRPGRLHDRIRYQVQETGKWKIDRLAP